MKRIELFQFIGKILAIVIIPALVLVAAPVQAGKKIEIQIWSNPLGSTGYTLSFGLAEIINKYSDKYTASCVETKSQSVNMLHLIKEPSARKNTIIYGNPPGYDNCKFGKPPFDKPYSNFGWISLVGNVIVVPVTTDPKIKKVEDLKGKRIAVGPKGHSTEFCPRLVLKNGYGIWDTLKINNLTFGGAKNALMDGTLKVGMAAAIVLGPGGKWKGNPATDELLTSRKCQLLSFSEEAIAKAREASGYSLFPITVGPRKYGKTIITKPVTGIALSLAWLVDKSMPDEYVKDILGIIYEHADEFAKFHATGKGITKKTMPKIGAPSSDFHPAAIKFYEDHGLKAGL